MTVPTKESKKINVNGLVYRYCVSLIRKPGTGTVRCRLVVDSGKKGTGKLMLDVPTKQQEYYIESAEKPGEIEYVYFYSRPWRYCYPKSLVRIIIFYGFKYGWGNANNGKDIELHLLLKNSGTHTLKPFNKLLNLTSVAVLRTYTTAN